MLNERRLVTIFRPNRGGSWMVGGCFKFPRALPACIVIPLIKLVIICIVVDVLRSPCNSQRKVHPVDETHYQDPRQPTI